MTMTKTIKPDLAKYITRLGWEAARGFALRLDEEADPDPEEVASLPTRAQWAEDEAYYLRLSISVCVDQGTTPRAQVKAAWRAGFVEGWLGEGKAERAAGTVWAMLMAAPFKLRPHKSLESYLYDYS
jgi:hypothetical protein